MVNSAVEIQLVNGVTFSSSDPDVVGVVLLGVAGWRLVSAIRSMPPSREPAYFGGNIYEPEADHAAFRALARRR